MSNLLDKASIILTPTAYNNGEALCVKPSDGSGDFDFSRNSAATRVNAQGLVENVQILSSNLVQNGDFSEEGVEEVSNGSFSQEGVELVTGTNSDMSGANSWVTGLGSLDFNINTTVQNKMWCNFTTGNQQVILPNTIEAGKSYLVSLTAKLNSGTATSVMIGGFTSNQTSNTVFNITPTSTTVTYSGYINSDTNTSLSIGIIAANNNGSDFEFDNVSVREVGQDWSLGTGWSIGEDKATVDNTVNANLDQTCLTSGKIYKVSFEISDLLSGGILVGDIVNPGAYDATSNGSHTFYYTATNSTLRVRAYGNPCSITNISVKEVGQNWDLQTGWQISNNKLNCLGASSQIEASTLLNFDITKKYKLVFTISGVDSGTRSFRVYTQGSNGGVIFSYTAHTNGTYEYYYDPSINGTKLAFQTAFNQSTFSIDDVSVIEITDDTNLPRINYEGFSYQDALGSEEIVNGGFDSDTAWIKSTGWSIANGTATYDGTGGTSALFQNGVIEINKTYKVTIDVISNEGSGINTIFLGNNAINTQHLEVGSYTFYGASTSGINLAIYGRSGEIFKIDNVSVKEYLGQEVVPDSGCGSWLFEPQSTNLVTYSEDFSQSFWTKQASVTLDKGYLAPDGTYNATKISGVIGSSYVVSQGGILSSSSTKSIWAKTTSGTGVIHLGANQNQSNASFTVTNEWQRFEVNGTTTDVYAVDFRNASTTLSEVLVWGAQGENLSYATSYIPTNGEANGVTRNQDVCTNGGSLASINSTEGTLYFEGSALANDGTTRIISLSDGTTANRVNLFFDTSNTLRAFITGVPSIATAAVITDNNKVALKFKSGDISVWLNGTEVATSTSTISLSGLSNLSFNQVGSSPFYGKTKALAVWKEALSDEELTELTTI